MYLKRRFYQIIVITTAIVQCRAEDGKQPVLGLSSGGLNLVRKKEQNAVMNHIRKRALKVATTNIFEEAFGIDDDRCCSESLFPSSTPTTPTTQSLNPTLNPTYTEKNITASDRNNNDNFGWSCSMSNDLSFIGAPGVDGGGAAYLFNLDGTEVAKLTPEENDYNFGWSIAMDEKAVVGSFNGDGDYVKVFSPDGIFERTLTNTCDDCFEFGRHVATFGNLIVTVGNQNSAYTLFIFTTEGQLLKSIEQEDYIDDVAISEQFIVSTSSSDNGNDKTFIYYNTSPDFPENTEINGGGLRVAVSSERIVIGDRWANNGNGVAYLYKTDGSLVTTLDRQDAVDGAGLGQSVAITDDKVLVGAPYDHSATSTRGIGSVLIYSFVTGEFIEKVYAADALYDDEFGNSVCASGSYYIVGAPGAKDDNGVRSGAAYLFNSPS